MLIRDQLIISKKSFLFIIYFISNHLVHPTVDVVNQIVSAAVGTQVHTVHTCFVHCQVSTIKVLCILPKAFSQG